MLSSRKRILFFSCMIAWAALAMATVSPAVEHFSMVSASPGGTWYTMVGGAVTLYTEKIPGTKFTIAGTGGSVENARRFVSGEADFGPVYSSHIFDLYHGTETMKGRPPSDAAQILCQIYDSPHYFVTLKGKGIKSIRDLAGKKVALGSPGSGTSANSKKTFRTLGINVNGIELSFGDAARQLQDGKIDALGQGGAPASGIVELAASQDIEVIPFSESELAKMVTLAPYYFNGFLPANTYRGQAEPVPTFFFAVFLCAHQKVPADIAYQVLKVTFSPEGHAFLSKIHPQWKTIKDNPEAVKQLGAKYHAGAVKFWKERGK
jgi:TRAP transporter TAXI family solute receptor